MLLPRIDSITHLADIARRSVETWETFQRQTRAAETMCAFAEHRRWVAQMSDQVARMQRLIAPVPDISRACSTPLNRCGAWARP